MLSKSGREIYGMSKTTPLERVITLFSMGGGGDGINESSFEQE